jgi:peptide deformylase
VLRRRSREVVKVDAALPSVAEQMLETMHAEEGIGLAAPQIGRNIRMIVLDVPAEEDDERAGFVSPGELALLPQMPLALVNPRLSDPSEQKATGVEGCLSIPGIRAEVCRPEFVQVDAETLDGRPVSCRCGGLLARCIQHEVDHLDGVLFVDRVTDDELKKVYGDLKRLAKKTEKALKKHRG